MPSAPNPLACATTITPFSAMDASLGIAQKPRQCGLAVQEWAMRISSPLCSDQVERIEDRGIAGLPTAQLLKP
jgi:hypothetical protein